MDSSPLVVALLLVVLGALAAYVYRLRTGRWPWRVILGAVAVMVGGLLLALRVRKNERLPPPDHRLADRVVGRALADREAAHQMREETTPTEPLAGKLSHAVGAKPAGRPSSAPRSGRPGKTP